MEKAQEIWQLTNANRSDLTRSCATTKTKENPTEKILNFPSDESAQKKASSDRGFFIQIFHHD